MADDMGDQDQGRARQVRRAEPWYYDGERPSTFQWFGEPERRTQPAGWDDGPDQRRRSVGWYAGPEGYLARRRRAAQDGGERVFDAGREARPDGPACPDCRAPNGYREIGHTTDGAAVHVARIGTCQPCRRLEERRAWAESVREAGRAIRSIGDHGRPVVSRWLRDRRNARRWRHAVTVAADRVGLQVVGPVVASAVDVASRVFPYVSRWDYAWWLTRQVFGNGLPVVAAWRQWTNSPRQDAYSRRLPYAIENVPGAPLDHSVVLCGSMFGLGSNGRQLRRHRLFECSFSVMQPQCQHAGEAIGVYGGGPVGRYTFGNGAKKDYYGRRGGYQGTVSEKTEAMGIDWMSTTELNQAIPPAYTEHIGHYLLAAVNVNLERAA